MEMHSTEQTPAKKSFAKRAGAALIWFLTAMLALTYLSRAVSQALKAKVETGYTSVSAIDESVEGTGEWKVGQTALYTLYFSRRITQVYVFPGDRVEAGQALFAYDVSAISGGKAVSRTKVESAEKALKKALKAQETAEDAAYAQSVVDNARQALSYAEFTYEQYYSLQHGGVVRATFSGIVTKHDLTVGKVSVSGVTGFEIAPDGLSFTMTVSVKESQRIAAGDTVILYRDGKAEKDAISVARIEAPDAEDRVTVVCQGDGGMERLCGAKQDWKIEKQSARYNTCVPIAALRQSGQEQYYVLVLTEKETILGTELIAQAREVKLLARDSRRAAVEGGIGQQDRLITVSSKELKDGDLVVLKDA